jgi:hypothetical protein
MTRLQQRWKTNYIQVFNGLNNSERFVLRDAKNATSEAP